MIIDAGRGAGDHFAKAQDHALLIGLNHINPGERPYDADNEHGYQYAAAPQAAGQNTPQLLLAAL
jgi:hypothetical protein